MRSCPALRCLWLPSNTSIILSTSTLDILRLKRRNSRDTKTKRIHLSNPISTSTSSRGPNFILSSKITGMEAALMCLKKPLRRSNLRGPPPLSAQMASRRTIARPLSPTWAGLCKLRATRSWRAKRTLMAAPTNCTLRSPKSNSFPSFSRVPSTSPPSTSNNNRAV